VAQSAFVTGGSGFIGGRLIRRLAGEGWSVRALARSPASEEKVRDAGAEPVRGDLEDVGAMRAGAEGCELVFHAAATVEAWGPWERFVRGNIIGTSNALAAARGAGVRRFVHVGTEAALMAGQPLVDVDERAPLRPDSPAPYPASKARAEQAVRQAADGLETVVVRPRFVWGAGDTTLLPGIVAMVRAGRFRWVGGGRHRTAITHVDNVVEGLLLGARRGRSGDAYFVTDGEPVVFREFVGELLRTQGVEPPEQNVPAPVARAAAVLAEAVWRRTGRLGEPPLTRFAAWVSSQECTIDISKARRELGYAPVKDRAEGLAELREESGAAAAVTEPGAPRDDAAPQRRG
jgi:nucleoside-diphosphate-sugar epimerase